VCQDYEFAEAIDSHKRMHRAVTVMILMVTICDGYRGSSRGDEGGGGRRRQ
jgi:hypothetical protein